MNRLILLFFCLSIVASAMAHANLQSKISTHSLNKLYIDDLFFKDLDKDGKLSPFEDWRLSPSQRATDLINHMNLAEKVGLIVYTPVPLKSTKSQSSTPTYSRLSATKLINDKKINHFIVEQTINPEIIAKQNNELQEIAERSRLGIPLTFRMPLTWLTDKQQKPYLLLPNPLGIFAINNARQYHQYTRLIQKFLSALGITGTTLPLSTQTAMEAHFPIKQSTGESPLPTEKFNRILTNKLHNAWPKIAIFINTIHIPQDQNNNEKTIQQITNQFYSPLTSILLSPAPNTMFCEHSALMNLFTHSLTR